MKWNSFNGKKKTKKPLSFNWYINKDEKWKKKKLCCTEQVIISYDTERNRSKSHTCPWWRQECEWSYNDGKWKEWVNVCIDIKLKLNEGYCRENTGSGGRRGRGKKNVAWHGRPRWRWSPLNKVFLSHSLAYGHTTLNTPDLVRSRKLSRVGPG